MIIQTIASLLGGAPLGPVPTLHAFNMDEFSAFEPAYPTGIAAGDWLLAAGMSIAADVAALTLGAQTGFGNLGASPYDALGGTEVRLWVRGKTAAGDETGNLAFSFSEATNSIAGIGRFSGVNVASPIEGIQWATYNDNPHTIPSITSLGDNRLAVFILAVSEQATPSDPLVDPGSAVGPQPTRFNWAGTTSGGDRNMTIYTAAMPTAGTISGWQQQTDFTVHEAGFLGFFVKPTGS